MVLYFNKGTLLSAKLSDGYGRPDGRKGKGMGPAKYAGAGDLQAQGRYLLMIGAVGLAKSMRGHEPWKHGSAFGR